MTIKNKFSVALALSGAAALIYQVAWQRTLTQIIGAEAISMVIIVTIFMICLGGGARLAQYLLTHLKISPLRLYVILEIVVAFYGIISIPLLRLTNYTLCGLGENSIIISFALNLFLLALPIIGMGLTTPLIIQVAKQTLQNVGRTVGGLYGWNIAGAACGAALTGLIFIELCGLIGTTYVAAILNLIAAAIAFNALKIASPKFPPLLDVRRSIPTKISFPTGVAAILFGYSTLAIQMIFFRVLSVYMTSSTIVFPMVLCAYLCLMALGQYVGGQLADKKTNLFSVIACLFTVGSIILLAALRFPPAWAAFFRALRFTSFNGQLISSEYSALIGDPSPVTVFLFSFFFMLSILPWSGLFPLMVRLTTNRIEEAGTAFARMYSLYVIGNVAGAFICGIFLLPLFGTIGSAIITIITLGLGCFILMIYYRAEMRLSESLSIIAFGISITLLLPQNYYKVFNLGKYSVIDVFEGPTGVVTVTPTSSFYTIIDMNRTASASALRMHPLPADEYQAWRWNHTDLMALDPEFRPKNILIIGIGHAYLIDAMLDLPFIQKITVIEISSEIIAAVKKHTSTSTKRIFADPRVKIIIADARRFVQSALKRGEKYDLIQNKINEPWHAGSGNLFTEEFFLSQKALLHKGGYLSVRPLIGHLAEGLKVFGNALWAGYYHIYFKNGRLTKPTIAMITPDIKKAWVAEIPGQVAERASERKKLSVAYFNYLPPQLMTAPNTDDRPTFEYYWLRKLLKTWKSPQTHLRDIDIHVFTYEISVIDLIN